MPYMVFTNMFAIFYLEVICNTKKTAKKQDEDKLLGHYINIGISSFYAIIFICLIIFSAIMYTSQVPNVALYDGIGE